MLTLTLIQNKEGIRALESVDCKIMFDHLRFHMKEVKAPEGTLLGNLGKVEYMKQLARLHGWEVNIVIEKENREKENG